MTNDLPRPQGATGTSRVTVTRAISSGAVGALLTLGFNLLLLPVVLRKLGPDLYGAWIALSALIAVAALADAGIRTEVARRVAAARGGGDEHGLVRSTNVGTTVMALTVTPVVILAVWGAPWLAALVFPTGVPGYSDAQIAMVLRVMVVAMAASLILGAHFAALKGLQRSDVEVAAQVLALPANAAVLLVGLLHGWGLWALAFAQLAGIAVAASVQAVGTRRLLPHLSFRPGLAGWPVVLSYLTLSTLALVSQVGDVFDSQWDKLVIARYVDSEAVTAFHVGTMLVLQAKALALLPLMPLLAGVAELRVARPREAQELQRSLVKVGAVASAVVLGGVFVFAPAFILLWLGPGYEEAGVVARIFTVAVALNLVVAPIAFQAFAEGAHRLAAVAALTNIAVNAFASLLLTVQVGLYGAAVGSVVGNMAGAGVLVALGRRRLRAWVSPAIRTPVLAAGAGGAVVISGVADVRSWPWLLASVLLFALAVGVSAARLEGISLRAAAGALRRRRP